MGESYQSTRARLSRMLRQKKMKEREKSKAAAASSALQQDCCVIKPPPQEGAANRKAIGLPENKSPKKKGVEERKVVEELVNFIEGIEMKERNEKRAAKKARQREKKRLEEEERARLLAEEEERKRREEEAIRLALERQAELELIEASKSKKKKKQKKSRVPPLDIHHPRNFLPTNNNRKPQTAVTPGGGNIVTIRRLIDQPSSKTFVTTVTLKGKSSTDDKVLYKFYSEDKKRPVLNYQTVDSEQYKKRPQTTTEASKPKTNFPSVIIGRDDSNNFVPLKVNNAVNNTPSAKASPKTFNIKDIKLPPCITITVKSNSTVDSGSPKEIERENAEPAKKSRRRRKPKQVAV